MPVAIASKLHNMLQHPHGRLDVDAQRESIQRKVHRGFPFRAQTPYLAPFILVYIYLEL